VAQRCSPVSWPALTRKDHEAFCTADGWKLQQNARGATGDHFIYELDLPDGRILRTRISHPVNRSGYGADMWAHILRDQLDVDAAVFWACVRGEALPKRGNPEPPAEALPAEVAYLLRERVRLSDSEIAALTRDEAIARLQRYWAEDH
jgi:hypothetical protein